MPMKGSVLEFFSQEAESIVFFSLIVKTLREISQISELEARQFIGGRNASKK